MKADLSLRPGQSTEQVPGWPGLHRETLCVKGVGVGWGEEDSVLRRGLGVPAPGSSSVTAQGQTEPSSTYSFVNGGRLIAEWPSLQAHKRVRRRLDFY